MSGFFGAGNNQPLDSDLTAIAALTTTTFGRSLLEAADAAAARTLLGVAFRGALVKKASDQTGLNATAGVALTWDTDVYDTDAFHDTGSNTSRLTIPAGVSKVRLTGGVHLNNATNGDFLLIYITKAGNFFAGAAQQHNDPGSTSPRASVSTGVIDVAQGDYFELNMSIQSDTSVDIESDSSWFAVEVVAP